MEIQRLDYLSFNKLEQICPSSNHMNEIFLTWYYLQKPDKEKPCCPKKDLAACFELHDLVIKTVFGL